MSWIPLSLQRAANWDVLESKQQTHQGHTLPRPATWDCEFSFINQDNCESNIVNKDKPLPPTPPCTTLNFAVDELFLPTPISAHEQYESRSIGVPTSSSAYFGEFCRLHEASMIMPLRDFLSWIQTRYNIPALTTHFKRRSPFFAYLPKDHYHDLLAMQTQYDPMNVTNKSGTSQAILHAVHTTLCHLRQDLEKDFAYLDKKHASMELRDFVMWAYCKFRPKRDRRYFIQSVTWNPHQITSSSRVVKEAVAYFSHQQFMEDRGVLCIHAKHIVYLLSGGKDWRESVRPDDALIVRHAEPSDRGLTEGM